MLWGLDGIEIGLLIVFLSLFAGILSGFPVAFAIGGAALVSFAIIFALDSGGYLIHQALDVNSEEYKALRASGVSELNLSTFRYPDLPIVEVPLFAYDLEGTLNRGIGPLISRINERVLAGQSIETLLAVLMFVVMGITLERSRIADELLTSMARIFGPLPGGLAVSIVVVGAFLAASTGIVGATVVTMGLLALPTMLRNGYSAELSTGVIAASGTLGQIIPPSIVIVLLGTLAGDIYSDAQQTRAEAAGCTDALTYLGTPAVLSVGTLFQAAMLPGILLAGLYAAYSFGFALVNPSKAPAVDTGTDRTKSDGNPLMWFLILPVLLIGAAIGLGQVNLVGNQTISVSSFSEAGESASLRTEVGEDCAASMIDLHGQEAWDAALAEQAAIEAAGGQEQARERTEDEIAAIRAERIAEAAPMGSGRAIFAVLAGIAFLMARGVAPAANPAPLLIGGLGLVAMLAVDIIWLTPDTAPGRQLIAIALPLIAVLYGLRQAFARLGQNDLLRVVFPPLVLIVAVLGSILGGITNPTPAAALGAGGAIFLAAFRKLQEDGRSASFVIWATLALVAMLLLGVNFDLRSGLDTISFENRLATIVAGLCFVIAVLGLLYSCAVLLAFNVLGPVVRESAKVTAMVFAILIGSQVLNVVINSFGGEHHIQHFLRSFDDEFTVFLLVMVILFILGFVLDFLEIIYIVVPIVGPVIYGGTFDPSWVTIMIAVNLQTSFLTPPFGFALFYLRGVAPPEVTTGHIYRGVLPFVLVQVAGLALFWFVPGIVTLVPRLLGG